MKIVAFSDIHCDVEMTEKIVEACADADVLVGAGDFAVHGNGLRDTIDVLKTVNVPTVLVSGNHDYAIELESLCAEWDLGHFLHGTAVEIDNVSFFGLGAEIPDRTFADWSDGMSEHSASQLLSRCPEDAILVTHTPPYGCSADLQMDGTHEGSRAIRAVVERKQPQLCLCGHIHFSWGASETIGKTIVHNLGPKVNVFEI